LLWAQPATTRVPASPLAASAVVAPPAQSGNAAAARASRPGASVKGATGRAADTDNSNNEKDDDKPLPGSSSSLPLLAVIGFGVLAGGITSAMRTR
jgi:hypothetical protein